MNIMQKAPSLKYAVLASAPFCVGAVLYSTDAQGATGPSLAPPCLFRTLVGIPCPLCGATRAVILFSHGDSRFLSYNPYWVFFLIGVAVVALILGIRELTGKQKAPPRWLVFIKTHNLGTALTVLALGWAVGLANHAAILS